MSPGSAWSVGASILTFAFPMILFLAVAASLFVAYTKPSVVPGHREQTVARPVGYTPAVRLPERDQAAGGQAYAGPHYVTGSTQKPPEAGQDATRQEAAGQEAAGGTEGTE